VMARLRAVSSSFWSSVDRTAGRYPLCSDGLRVENEGLERSFFSNSRASALSSEMRLWRGWRGEGGATESLYLLLSR
jgi:hypothetical protein